MMGKIGIIGAGLFIGLVVIIIIIVITAERHDNYGP